MSDNNHISDADLQQVVLEQQTRTPQELIETHISDCNICQERLLEMAADPIWRKQLANSFSDAHSISELDRTSVCNGNFSTNARSGDEFDLQTVDHMLSEVLQPPTHPETLGRLGRYEVEDVIGCGGMGVVLRGFDRDLHRPVAIKMILPRLSRNGTAKQRFSREARAAAAVLHPNVISIHDISETGGVPWFVMPLVVGPSLKSLVDQNGPLPEREIARIGMQIASGLAAAHSQGLVHRDIKPENILVDNQVNRVVITDFGLARRDSEETVTQTGMLAGTINYMSPEQSRGEDIDARSDLFSLGSLIYYLATGTTPFHSDGAMGVIHKIGNEQQANVQSLNPEISTTLAQVTNRLLEKKAEHRFQSAVELEALLNDYISHLNRPHESAKPKVPVVNKPRSASWKTTVLCSAALLAITFFSIVKFWPAKSTDAIWADVKEKYQIAEESQFHEDVNHLATEVDAARQQFGKNLIPTKPQSIAFGEKDLLDDLMRLTRDIGQLSDRIGTGSPEPKPKLETQR